MLLYNLLAACESTNQALIVTASVRHHVVVLYNLLAACEAANQAQIVTASVRSCMGCWLVSQFPAYTKNIC